MKQQHMPKIERYLMLRKGWTICHKHPKISFDVNLQICHPKTVIKSTQIHFYTFLSSLQNILSWPLRQNSASRSYGKAWCLKQTLDMGLHQANVTCWTDHLLHCFQFAFRQRCSFKNMIHLCLLAGFSEANKSFYLVTPNHHGSEHDSNLGKRYAFIFAQINSAWKWSSKILRSPLKIMQSSPWSKVYGYDWWKERFQKMVFNPLGPRPPVTARSFSLPKTPRPPGSSRLADAPY